jgi:hypothetical protein
MVRNEGKIHNDTARGCSGFDSKGKSRSAPFYSNDTNDHIRLLHCHIRICQRRGLGPRVQIRTCFILPLGTDIIMGYMQSQSCQPYKSSSNLSHQRHRSLPPLRLRIHVFPTTINSCSARSIVSRKSVLPRDSYCNCHCGLRDQDIVSTTMSLMVHPWRPWSFD